MNVAGKSLQDIYDAGARKLDELEQSEKASLAEAGDSHLDERAHLEPDSLKALEVRSEELESEIRAFLQRGLERVDKTVKSESAESELHISRLVEGLVLLTKKFSESISQLRQLAESQLSDQGEDCQHVYALHAQTACSELLNQGTLSAADVRDEAVDAEAKLADLIEKSWRSVYEKENETLGNLDECFENDRDSVSDSFSRTRTTLNEGMQERLGQLQSRAKTAQDAIRILVERVVEQSDRHAFDTDVKLKEGFSSLLYELASSFDDSALRAGGEIASLHESSMADLTMKSQELSREMDSLAGDMTGAANDRSNELQDRSNLLMDGYTGGQSDKLQTSNVFHQDLAAERALLVSEIWNELTELRQKFDDKLRDLSSSTLTKMRGICEEAETAIVSSQHNCCSDSKSHAATKQTAIDTASRDFLKRVEQIRKAALDGIARAAGDEDESSESEDSNGNHTVTSDNSGNGSADSSAPAPVSAVRDENNSESDSSDDDDEPHSSGSVDSTEGQANPRPADNADNDTESGGEPRKRRKSRTDKRSPGDAKK